MKQHLIQIRTVQRQMRLRFLTHQKVNHIQSAKYTKDRQNNGTNCERYTFLNYYKVVPPFACNTACILLAIDWYTCSEQSPVQYCATVHEEHLPVAWEMLEEGLCWSLYSLKLTTAIRWCLCLTIVLAREDTEVCLHAAPTKSEHFWVCVCVCVCGQMVFKSDDRAGQGR